ncbi:hypothetical protein DENSPDRAFT_886496 [Dentipellis sp. KUC8613]|nr:hypothetical protein DENSPDRAFT_886496 [Dentipellis sp. KUC8613]
MPPSQPSDDISRRGCWVLPRHSISYYYLLLRLPLVSSSPSARPCTGSRPFTRHLHMRENVGVRITVAGYKRFWLVIDSPTAALLIVTSQTQARCLVVSRLPAPSRAISPVLSVRCSPSHRPICPLAGPNNVWQVHPPCRRPCIVSRRLRAPTPSVCHTARSCADRRPHSPPPALSSPTAAVARISPPRALSLPTAAVARALEQCGHSLRAPWDRLAAHAASCLPHLTL